MMPQPCLIIKTLCLWCIYMFFSHYFMSRRTYWGSSDTGRGSWLRRRANGKKRNTKGGCIAPRSQVKTEENLTNFQDYSLIRQLLQPRLLFTKVLTQTRLSLANESWRRSPRSVWQRLGPQVSNSAWTSAWQTACPTRWSSVQRQILQKGTRKTDFLLAQEISRLAGQLRRLYGSNKKAKRPFHLFLTDLREDSRLYRECVRMNDGFLSYTVIVVPFHHSSVISSFKTVRTSYWNSYE